jgi:hypothetical protein
MKKRTYYLLLMGLAGPSLLSSCEKEELTADTKITQELTRGEKTTQYSNGSSSDPYVMIVERTLYPLPKPDVDPTIEPDPEPDPWREK